MKIIAAPILVVVFGQPGCPSCEEYVPVFREVAKTYESCIPTLVLDATQHEALADHFRVQDTPTTIVLRFGRLTTRPLVGALDEKEINEVFRRAARGVECSL